MKANPMDVATAGTQEVGQELSSSAHSSAQERGYLIVLALMMILLASVYPLLRQSVYEGSSDLHATIEMVGALFGLVAGVALIVRFYTLGNRFHLFIGLAFFVNGAEDFVHGLLAFRNLFGLPASSVAQFIPGTYVTGRLLLGVILLLAPSVPIWFGESKNPKRETKWISSIVVIVSIVLTALAFQSPLPNFIYPENLISRPVDFLSGIVLLVALAAFLRKYHQERDMLTWWVALSIGVNVVGQVLMSFSKALYDPFFDIAHVYKVLGYMIPLLGFSLYQITVITERQQAEQSAQDAQIHLHEMLQSEQEQREHLQATVQKYVEYMAEVGQGNLLARLTLDGDGHGQGDPLLVLGHNLNEMTASLQGMILQIREAANNLSSAAAEILAATTQQALGANEQSAAISQTTTTVDEVKTISEQAIARAQEVVDASQRTVEVSRSGQQTVQDTFGNMAQIKARVEGIAENILALSEQTQQIGDIIATVNDLAAQSNILALNASVEAARAGEHGKGFAVVAIEVRNLAEQSKQATAQVKDILLDIQKGINTTVMATEEGTKVVDQGVQLTAQTREVIEQLSGVIDESAQTAMQVMAGGRQQASGVEQIALAMQNINQATMQSLSSTRQAEKAAQELNDLARTLTETVEQYQL